jgi:Ca2+-binding RTX toxin-like protein
MANVYGTNDGEIINASDGVTGSADVIFGYLGNDVIYGLGGDDKIKGGGGADWIVGGSGSDTVEYTDSNVGVSVNLKAGGASGGTAQGDVFGSIENVTGSGQGDTIIGNDEDNVLRALEGDDNLTGGGGADYLSGGTGIDTAIYTSSPWGVTVSLADHIGYYGDAAGDQLYNIENLDGSSGEDVLIGDDNVNVLRGGQLEDTLKGGGGADTLQGGTHDDYLDGGAGIDTMEGGTGNDTYIVDHPSDVVIEEGGEGTLDRVKTYVSYGLAAGEEIEILETAVASATTAISLVGNAYSQTIIGNAGGNVIAGGAGLDSMVGGDGADLFVWNAITEVGTTLDANSDTVGSDFNPLIGDLMALNLIDADGNGGNGDTAFTFIGDASNPFTAAGQASWLIGGPDTYILLNTDGDAAADGVIRVLGAHTVDASWFVL